MKLNVRFIMGAFFALTIIVSSCNTFKDEITPDNYSEVAKNINANWSGHYGYDGFYAFPYCAE